MADIGFTRAERAAMVQQGVQRYEALRSQLEKEHPGCHVAVSIKSGRWCLTEYDEFTAFVAALEPDDYLWTTRIATPAQREHAAEIEKLAQLHKRSRTARLICRLKYLWLRWRNEPLPFRWVDDDGEPVGEPIVVEHMTLYDMMEHQARGIMTAKILLSGLRVNAIQVLGFERLDSLHGKTTIQPRWV